MASCNLNEDVDVVLEIKIVVFKGRAQVTYLAKMS